MSFYGLIVGAIAGAVGAALGWGLTALIWADREPAERPKWLIAISVVLLVALTRPLVQWLATPSVEKQLATAERELPALAALRETDPSEYDEVKAAARQTQSGAITEAEGMARVHAALMRALSRKLPTAPDTLLQAQAELAATEYFALEGTPAVCVNYISGTGVVDLRRYLPPEVFARDQSHIARVLRSRPTGAVNVASESEVQEAAEPILTRIAQQEDLPLSEVVDALNMQGDKGLICRVFARLFQHISELPTEKSAAIMRGLNRMNADTGT